MATTPVWDRIEKMARVKLKGGEARTMAEAVEQICQEWPNLYSGYKTEEAAVRKREAELSKIDSDYAWLDIEHQAHMLVDEGKAKSFAAAVVDVTKRSPGLYEKYRNGLEMEAD